MVLLSPPSISPFAPPTTRKMIRRGGRVVRLDAPRGASTGCWGPRWSRQQKGTAVCRWIRRFGVAHRVVRLPHHPRSPWHEGTPSNPPKTIRLPPYRTPCSHPLPLSVETGLGPSNRTTQSRQSLDDSISDPYCGGRKMLLISRDSNDQPPLHTCSLLPAKMRVLFFLFRCGGG